MSSFVFRVKDQDRRLYARRELYVSIRREWENESRLFFASKIHIDLLMGSGIIEKIIEVDVMNEQERRLCLQNNWYGKIVFGRVQRFLPPLSVQDTPLARTRPALLHGLDVPEEQAAEIDSLVSSRIIS